MADDALIVDDVFSADIHEALSRWAGDRSIEVGAVRLDGRDRRGIPALVSASREHLGRWLLGESAKDLAPAYRREHWRRALVAVDPHNLADIAGGLAADPALAPVDAAWTSLSRSLLADSILVGCEVEARGPGIDGRFETEGVGGYDRTVILFLGSRWPADRSGETALLGEADDLVRTASPAPNRAIVAPASVRRAQRPVADHCPERLKVLLLRIRRRRSQAFETLSGFLRDHGALDCNHYDGTLHDHLMRTFAALEARGCRPAVCLGGGLHSIYGTSLLDHRMLGPADRAGVAQRLGCEAERLSYLFSSLNRPRTLATPLALDERAALVELRDGGRLELSRQDFDDLRLIDCANLEDQDTLKDYPPLADVWAAL